MREYAGYSSHSLAFMAVPPGPDLGPAQPREFDAGRSRGQGSRATVFCPVHRGGWNILAVFAAEEGTFVADTRRFRRRTVRITHGEKVVSPTRPPPSRGGGEAPARPAPGLGRRDGPRPDAGRCSDRFGMRVPPCRPGRWRKAARPQGVRRRIIRERLVGYPGCCGGLAGDSNLDQLIRSTALPLSYDPQQHHPAW